MKVTFILFAIICFYLVGAAQTGPQKSQTQGEGGTFSFPLTDSERQQWAQFGEVEKGLMGSLQATAPLAKSLSASNEKDAIRYLSAMKEIFSAIDMNVLQRALWLEQMRGKYKCPGCVVEDGKLVAAKEKEVAGAGK